MRPYITWPRRLAKSSSMEAMSVTLVGDPHDERLGELVPCLALNCISTNSPCHYSITSLGGEGDRNGVLMSSSRPRELLKLLLQKFHFLICNVWIQFYLRVDIDRRVSNLFASGSSIPCWVLSRRESFQFVLSLKGSAISFLEFCFFRLFLESSLGRLTPCFSFCKESHIDLAAPPPIPVPIAF